MFTKIIFFILTLEELFSKGGKLFLEGFAGDFLCNTFLQLQFKKIKKSFAILK